MILNVPYLLTFFAILTLLGIDRFFLKKNVIFIDKVTQNKTDKKSFVLTFIVSHNLHNCFIEYQFLDKTKQNNILFKQSMPLIKKGKHTVKITFDTVPPTSNNSLDIKISGEINNYINPLVKIYPFSKREVFKEVDFV